MSMTSQNIKCRCFCLGCSNSTITHVSITTQNINCQCLRLGCSKYATMHMSMTTQNINCRCLRLGCSKYATMHMSMTTQNINCWCLRLLQQQDNHAQKTTQNIKRQCLRLGCSNNTITHMGRQLRTSSVSVHVWAVATTHSRKCYNHPDHELSVCYVVAEATAFEAQVQSPRGSSHVTLCHNLGQAIVHS
jgi:hypothetical protein